MSKLRSFCELVRLPNVFTAVADVLAGYWLVGEQLHASAQLGMLMLASATLYSAGIVLNDLADREVDRLERPNRPLPAGRVTIRQAWSLGATLCIAGCLSALGAASGGGGIRPFVVCIMLALAILSYDFVLKSTAIGPLNMGICRGLNVLMGLSAGWWLTADVRVIAPIALCGYVAAFSYFGRGEAAASARSKLVVPGVGIVCSIVLLGFLAAWRMAEESHEPRDTADHTKSGAFDDAIRHEDLHHGDRRVRCGDRFGRTRVAGRGDRAVAAGARSVSWALGIFDLNIKFCIPSCFSCFVATPAQS